jgi:hypothetical protein
MRIASTLLIALQILLCAACWDGDDQAGMRVPENQLSAVRLLYTDVRLPSSASNVWLLHEEFQGETQLVRFDSRIDEARSFARALLGRAAIRGEDPHFAYLSEGLDWWFREYPAGSEGGTSNGHVAQAKIVLMPIGRNARVWVSIARP